MAWLTLRSKECISNLKTLQINCFVVGLAPPQRTNVVSTTEEDENMRIVHGSSGKS